ncbi:hypothetical protein HON52_01345 [Candidatus Uhrbacteria bacterium]|jgi:hypothetical protein|nr:hypothetical protein [Candidatus Uhrbacteria bacterium]
MKIFRLLTQFVIIAVPVVLFLWLLVIDIAPSGERYVTWGVDEPSPFIDRLLPDQRLLEGQTTAQGELYVSIIDEPVYFGMHLPHTDFDEMEVALTFKNDDQPIVELGSLVDIQSQSYDLRPLHNRIIDELDWEVLESDGAYLYQRAGNYASIDEFVESPPERSTVAVYHADLETPYRMESYQQLGVSQTFDVSLRGYHKYVTYIKDETFDLAVSWMDMNRTAGADEGAVRLRNEDGDVLYEHFFDDDENITENQVSDDGYARITYPDLPEGVYSVELSGTSDIFWRAITTTQRYVSFVNKINLGDDVGHLAQPRATTFYTNAKHLTAQTLHADATQRITVGSGVIVVDETHRKMFHDVDDLGVVSGLSPVGDIEIVGDGKFAFSQAAFFDPDPISMNAYSDVDVQGIDYVLTTYESPLQVGDWLVASGLFDLASLRSLDELKMTVSVPGIETFQGVVDVTAIDATFIRETLDVRGFLSAVRELLPFGL